MKKGKFKLKKGYVVQKLQNKTVIFDGEKSTLYTFNSTASYIFEKIRLGYEEGEILKSIVETYNVPISAAKNDFKELIDDLLKKRIISQ